MSVKRFVRTTEEIDDIILHCKMKREYIIVGTGSVFIHKDKVKYLNAKHCRNWPNALGEIVPMTVGEIVRTEVSRAFPEKKPRRKYKGDDDLRNVSPPMIFVKPYKGMGTHIDLVSAYWQIYKWLTLDMSYPRSVGQYHLGVVAEKLKSDKVARNTLIGMARGATVTCYRGFDPVQQLFPSVCYCPDLWHFVQMVLNEIALVAYSLGAIYVNTDGYFFPEGAKVGHFKRFLDWLDMDYREATADSDIKRFGCYRSGLKPSGTKNFRMSQPVGLDDTLFNINLDRSVRSGKFGENCAYFVLQKDKQAGYCTEAPF